MQQFLRLPLLIILFATANNLIAQCITDECGDIFADWALASQEITVCEGATFEVINQTVMPDIDFYVWDWGNGERDTVFEVSNFFYTYLFEDGAACATDNDFIVYNISLEIYRFCDEGQSCHTQIAPVAIRFAPRASFLAPTIVCADEPVELVNGSCNGDEFLWVFGDGTTSTEENPEHVFDTAGVYDVQLYVTNSCGTDSLSVPVQVINQPEAEAFANGSDNAIGCVPLTVSFENASAFADTYNWTFPDSAGVVFQDTFSNQSPAPTVTFTEPGTYTVSLAANNDCGSNEWTTTITVLEPPQLELAPLPDACESAEYALGDFLTTTGDISSYTWTITGPANPSVPDNANPLVNFPAAGDYQIELTVSNGFCETATDTSALFIQVPDSIVLELLSPGPICDASDPVSLSASPAGGFWTGVGIDSSGLFDPAVAGLGNHSLQYQVLDGACIYGDSLSVEILVGQNVNTSDEVLACENDTIISLDFSPTGGAWSGMGITDPAAGLFDPNTSGAGTFELLYELTDPSGCLISKTTMAEVQALPLIAAPDTSVFCIDATTILLQDELTPTTDPGGGSLSWSGDFITDTNNGTFNPPGEGSYPVQINYSLDQCVATNTIVVNIQDPDEAVAGPDQSVCISENTLSLSGTPAGGQWSGPGVVDAFAGLIDLNQAGSGEHPYYYTLAEGSSCEVSDTVMVDVQGPGNLDAGLNLAFCEGLGQQSLPTPTPAGGVWSGPALDDPAQGLINTDQLTVGDTYWYSYSITNAGTGCSFADSVAVEIQAIPDVNLTLPNYVCAAGMIELGTEPQAGITYNWTLNNNTFSGDSISLTIADSGTYEVSLSATNSAGCVNSTNSDLQVANLPNPAFALDLAEGCGPLSVSFFDASNGIDMQYSWNFGNGQTSNQANPADIIYAPGIFDTIYQISLTVGNDCGVAHYLDTVNVLARPVADFGTPVDNGCGPLEISFANVTTGNADSYFWDFGNGQTSIDSLPSNQIFTTTDTAATTYQVLLIATNTCGSDSIQKPILVEPSNVTPFFGVDDNQGCAPLSVQFTNYSTFGASVTWDFGDGNTGVGPDVGHTFTEPGFYTVYQYVNTACASDSTMTGIEVLPSPDALFDHPVTVCPDQSILFENQSSEFLTIFWDFGDGNVSTATDPEHTYAEPGTYPVTMVISSSAFLCQATHNSSVEVLERPSSSIISEGGSGCPPLDLCFEAEVQGANFFEWTFGDENSSTSINPCHTFAESGQYTVQFRAADDQGCFSQFDTISVRVFEEPVAEISIPEDLYCGEEQEITFSNNSNGATNYEWSFSNGLTSALLSPTITFMEAGEQTATLLVSNTFNCQDEANLNFTIVPQPLADFAPILVDNCAPQTVIFDNATLNATEFLWDFGNGQTSTEPNPSLDYNEAGSYDVSLVATYDGLCWDSLRLNGSVELLPRPVAAFSWDIPTDTYRGIVRFTNESVNADQYLWSFGDGGTSEEENPIYDYERNGSWSAALISLADNGCVDTAFVDVEPDFMYDLFFPNALSPESGEGDVKVFRPAGVGLSSWKLEIFSPWGQRVFISEEMNEDQPAAAWDGSYNGDILPQGAYAYKATVEYENGVRRIYTGSVTLIR
ncbi:MAG: PKD domain-containing protein [Bacteroidota bacterium]